MILTTIDTVPGCQIVEHYGLVVGSTVQTKNVFVDIQAFCRNLIGGEVEVYSDLLRLGCEEATARLSQQAAEAGANAVINIRISTASLAAGAAEVLVYGTAVRVVC